MTWRWLRRLWSQVCPLVPHRRDICDRLNALPPLPEAGRMQTRRLVVKPKRFEAWKRKAS